MENGIKLGLNLNCFSNRYVTPRVWTEQVSALGINYVQFNADILDPMLPWKIQERVIKETLQCCQANNIRITSSFGGHNHHQNYLGHPDEEIANYYERFYERLIRQTAHLGAAGVGTCYAIMTVNDSKYSKKRMDIIKRAAESYSRLAEYAKKEGLKYLMFETTSVPRESCATFEETDYVLGLLSKTAVPFRLCLDVGHRNVEDHSRKESRAIEWILKYGKIAPMIHIHQCNNNGSHHWPFTSAYNLQGDVSPIEVITAIKNSGAEDVLLALEVNHKAFHPYESQVMNNLEESINYWRSVI